MSYAPASLQLTPADLDVLNDRFESAPAETVIAWAVEAFGDGLVLTTSLSEALLVDLVLGVCPTVPVVFVDTGYHFPETLETLGEVRRRYHPQLVVVSSDAPKLDLWQTDPDACCAQRKVQPLDAALADRTAWFSGLRRVDSVERAGTPVLQRDRRGLVKINPIATWSDERVEAYSREHRVVRNPLLDQGYPSVGCWPCTRAVAPGEDRRAGRWAGQDKTECGLHL